MGRELARHRQEWVAKRQVRYQEIDAGLKRHVGLRRYAPKWSKIMTHLLNGKHFWIALELATLFLIVIAPLRIRRSAPHRFAPNPAASLRTVETRYRHTYIEITRHTFDAVTGRCSPTSCCYTCIWQGSRHPCRLSLVSFLPTASFFSHSCALPIRNS